MNAASFRVRIAVLSGGITAGLLVLVLAVVWQASRRSELARMDRELVQVGQPHLERFNGVEHWRRLEATLRSNMGHDREVPYILQASERDRLLHQSAHWPPGLLEAGLAPPGRFDAALVPDPESSPPPPPRRSEPISRANPALPRRAPAFATVDDGGREWRVATLGNPYVTLHVGTDMGRLEEALRDLRRAGIAAFVVGLLLAGLGGWVVAGQALRPITLHGRRFSADAAHELRTPITVLHMELESAMANAAPGSETQRLCSRLIEALARIRSVIDKLLLLSQADAGRLPLQPMAFALSEALLEAADDARILAPGIEVETAVAQGVVVEADPHLLPQLLQNLLGNAVRHNRPGGQVRVVLERQEDHVQLTVSNTGPGIPAAELPRLFERFHRIDASRSRTGGGAGLGLSLAREIAHAHGGTLTLVASDASWTTFRLRLPFRGARGRPWARRGNDAR
ncbi:MAG: sensor histidine kinase [Verrucomicrobiota bacterium]